MKITRRQLRRIIKESILREQAGPNPPTDNAKGGNEVTPTDVKTAVALGGTRGGRPDMVMKDIESFRTDGASEDILGAYMAGFHMKQAEMDMWYDDVPGYYPGKIADDIAAAEGIEMKKVGSYLNQAPGAMSQR